MKRKYVLINGEKLNMPTWLKWIIFIASYVICLSVIAIVESLISKLTHIDVANVRKITFYLRGVIALSFIHDLAPRFKRSMSIIYVISATSLYSKIDSNKVGDTLHLGTIIFLVAIILYARYLYNKDLG